MNPNILRAARALKGWSRQELGEQAGVHFQTIASIEKGEQNPGKDTADKLEAVLNRNNIGFDNNSVFYLQKAIYEIDGSAWYQDLLTDVYFTCKERPAEKRSVLIFYADNSQSSGAVIESWRKIRDIGTTMRCLVKQGDTYLHGPVDEYRWVPEEFYNNYVQLVYADRVAFSSRAHKKAIVFKDSLFYETAKKQFEYMWRMGEQPQRSTADERY